MKLMKQNKKGKNCAVFCFAGKKKLVKTLCWPRAGAGSHTNEGGRAGRDEKSVFIDVSHE